MKKLFYIVLIVVALFVISQVIKNKQAETTAPAVDAVDTVEAVETNDGVVIEEDAIAIDEDTGAVVEEEAVEVIEENPDATSGDDETVVKE